MSDFCSTFVPDFNRNMKKTYIQPEIETTIYLSKGIMTPGSPTDGSMDPMPAPRRRDQVF